MDSSRKPQKDNPRKDANIISQLLFAWMVPLLYRGSRKGLNSDDLTKSLDGDNSEELGDLLEEKWEQEKITAKRKKRKPNLRNALFQSFYKATIVDGILRLLFVLLKTVLPLVLAQLLIQYQQPTSELFPKSILLNQTTVFPIDEMPTTMLTPIIEDSVVNNSRMSRDTMAVLSELHSNKHLKRFAVVPDDYEKSSSGGRQLNEVTDDKKPSLYNNPNLDESDVVDMGTISAVRSNDQNIFEFIWTDIACLTTIILLMVVCTVTLAHHTDLRQRIVGARMRIACCSAIYRKTLRLSKKASSETAAGYVVNLLSNDVSRLDYGFVYAHYIWILPLQSVFICWLIWRQIGIASLVGVLGLLLQTVPVQTGLSKLSSILRMKIAVRTDKRVGIMNELIQGIQVIKMYAWEIPFQKVVAEARRTEVKQIRYASYIRAINLSTMVFTERSTLFITIAACVFLGRTVSADIVFSMAQYFNTLQLIAAIFYPLAMSLGAEALVSITRVEQFLTQEEHDTTLKGLKTNKSEKITPNSPILLLNDVVATWSGDTKRKTLDGITTHVNAGNLCAIIGPVGAGKSSLLQLILGELPLIGGNVEIRGDLSYGSQEPWLFPGSVRNNILFGLPYDKKRYQDVVTNCALLTDFEQLPNGDKTIVGERGSSLSGGQKARISLARAVYKRADIYLLDDPLSAVDSHVGKHLFDEVIGRNGFLARDQATRILITHQVHFLNDADWIVIVEDGRISQQGTYKELSNCDLDFAKILQKIDDPKEQQENLKNEVDIYLPDETDDIPYIDGYMPIPRQDSQSTVTRSTSKLGMSSDDISVKGVDEEQAEGSIAFSVWTRYFGAGGSCFLLLMLVGALIFAQIVTSGSDYFVNFWTQQEFLRANDQETKLTTEECLYYYGSLIIGVIIMTTYRSCLFFKICMTASKNLHNNMFKCILHAPMRFFDTNPSGRILNRFSRDMGSIDELLPRAMIEAVQIILIMTGILAMVLIVNSQLIVPLIFAVIFYGLVLKLYMRPAQDFKRLEGICRSPVFSHLSASLNGLSIIRSNRVERKVTNEFDVLQDVHSGIWHLTMASNAACGLWLDYVSAIFVGCVAFSFLLLEETFAGNVGLAISQALILTGMVQYGVRQSTESIQQMTSVERVLQYSDLEQEVSPERRPKESWPEHGHIKFNRMSLRYDPKGEATLKDLKMEVQAGWKVGIVGRTGAGKSSLIGALFRLAHIEGEISIDDIDTGSISLESLRTKVSIIPQDPVLFSATIRYNLDPFGLFSDDRVWNALAEVELKQEIGHLDYMVTEGGNNFSVGQRQLVCLARAILRNNKVLVLDEATANVDPQTDILIQKTIRTKFAQCTVLTIAHRLHTVMDSDRILVMEAGYAREFDIPHVLLQNANGLLNNMVEATGDREAESLRKVAAVSWTKMINENVTNNEHKKEN